MAQYISIGVCVAVYDSLAEAALSTGAGVSNISECCHSKRMKAGGFMWEFAYVV